MEHGVGLKTQNEAWCGTGDKMEHGVGFETQNGAWCGTGDTKWSMV